MSAATRPLGLTGEQDGVNTLVGGGVNGVNTLVGGGVDGVNALVGGGMDGVNTLVGGGVDRVKYAVVQDVEIVVLMCLKCIHMYIQSTLYNYIHVQYIL